MQPASEQRVLVRTATVKDARYTGEVLQRAGFAAVACDGMAQLVEAVDEGAGALLLVEEALPAGELARLESSLES